MGVPASSSHWPQSVESTQQHYFKLSRRDPNQNNQFVDSGPYLCRHMPADGSLVVADKDVGKQTVVDERLWMPLSSGVTTRSVVTNVQTGRKSNVVFVKRFGNDVECYVVHQAP